MFVVWKFQHNLLGIPAIRELEIITGISAVELNVLDQYQYAILFDGLGTFKSGAVEQAKE